MGGIIYLAGRPRKVGRLDAYGIPFPYSDMTTKKRRPVFVVTGSGRHNDFMGPAVLSAETKESAVAIDAGDMAAGTLPKKSWIRYDKLFTLSSHIITKTYGSLWICRI